MSHIPKRAKILLLALFAAASLVIVTAVRKFHVKEPEQAAPKPAAEAPKPEIFLEPAAPGSALNIAGDEEFKKHITNSLKLIWLYDRDSFLFIRKSVYQIRKADRTDFRIIDNIPEVLISPDNAYKSITWCAGIIAHQSFHLAGNLTKTAQKTKMIPLPGEKPAKESKPANPAEFKRKTLSSLLDEEAGAGEFQIRVLQKTGAPLSEINPVRKRDSKDFSVSHDGAYSLKP
ncbi:MAG: hypothetical protein HY746_02360 [Elusimicrobia bacterium]|nr:hypothetical protein [Elusimicrobiota bacterium]